MKLNSMIWLESQESNASAPSCTAEFKIIGCFSATTPHNKRFSATTQQARI